MKQRPSKNNNLSAYREKLLVSNEALVRKAIAHIRDLSGEINFSAVSKVTYDLADIQNGQTGITAAGISVNLLYRALVEEAMGNSTIHMPTGGRAVSTKYSAAEMHLRLHALRVENARLKQEKKILTLKLKEVPDVIQTVEPIRNEIIKKGNDLQNIARSMVTRLCELEVAYIDMDSKTLKLAVFNEPIVHQKALELFYEKELHDIENTL